MDQQPQAADSIDEHLVESAPHAFALALRLCIDCQQYHALRPYLRLSKETAGVRTDWDKMEAELAALIAAGRRRVLIIGAGDFGIASLVLSAARGQPVAVTVLDRCAAPLVLIHELAARHGHRVRSLQDDLATFDLPGAFDLVVGHHVLPFVAADKRLAMLRRSALTLAPGGRLYMAVRNRAWRSWRDTRFGEDRAIYAHRFIDKIERDLAQQGIALPPEREIFDRHLREHAAARQIRVKQYDTDEELQTLFEAAGLAIERKTEGQDKRPAHEADEATRPRFSGHYITARAAHQG